MSWWRRTESTELSEIARGPYAIGAEAYWRAGWTNVVPIHDGTPARRPGKSHPVTGYTGKTPRNVSWPDLTSWITGDEGRWNLGLRLQAMVGIDVDAHDGEVGAETMAKAEADLGPLPPTYSSTSRGPGPSRIAFFRVPLSREPFLERREKAFVNAYGGNVEILHRGHRFAVAWPSVHPDIGQVYQWYGPDGQLCGVPRREDIPELPETWLNFLAPEMPAEVAAAPTYEGGQEVSRTIDGEVVSSSLLFGGTPFSNERTIAEATRILREAMQAFISPTADGRATRLLPALAMIAGHGVPGGFWTAQQAREAIEQQANACGYVKKHGLADLRNQVERGLRDGAAKPWTLMAEIGQPTAFEVAADETDPDIDTWVPIDVSPVLSGDFTPVRPELGMRHDGQAVLYPGKEHSIASEPECGKTWWVLMQVRHVLATGGRVVYTDFEDDEGTIVGRLHRVLGTPAELLGQRTFRYVRPETMPRADQYARLLDFGDGLNATLVVLDGVTEGLGLIGGEVNSQESAAMWRRVFVKPAMRLGAATLSTDHVVKKKEDRGRFAIGGQHKLAGLNGAMFKLEQVDVFGQGMRGKSRVLVTKDRNGGLRSLGDPTEEPGVTHLGDLIGDDTSETPKWRFYAPYDALRTSNGASADASLPKKELRPAVDAIKELLLAKPDLNTGEVKASIPMRATVVTQALTWLRLDGQVLEDPGARGVKYYRLADSFYEASAERMIKQLPPPDDLGNSSLLFGGR